MSTPLKPMKFDYSQGILEEKIIEYLKFELNQELSSLTKQEHEFLYNKPTFVWLPLEQRNALSLEARKKYDEEEALYDAYEDYIKNHITPAFRHCQNRLKVIQSLESGNEAGGQCVGLSTLWSYGKKIDDEPSSSETKKAKDDIAFFKNTWQRFLLWNEKQLLTKEDKDDFHRFISNVRFYQNPFCEIAYHEATTGEQLDLAASLRDTKHGAPLLSFDQKITCDKVALQSRLSAVIKPRSMIFFRARGREQKGHAMAIYQDSQHNIDFYDPNNKSGEIRENDLKKLTDILWEASNPEDFEKGFGSFDPLDSDLRRELRFTVYRFPEDPNYEYPSDAAYKLSTTEFLRIAKDLSFITLVDKPLIQSLMNSLDEFQIMEILDNKELDIKIKKAIIEHCIMFRDDKSQLLARYILVTHKATFEEVQKKYEGIKKYSEQIKTAKDQFVKLANAMFDEKRYLDNEAIISKMKHLLYPGEALWILMQDKNIGNQALAEDLLKHCIKNSQNFSKFAPLYWVLEKNIESGNFSLATWIAGKMVAEFNMGLSLENIMKLGSEAFAEFLHKNYDDFYRDRWGNSQLEFMSTRIKGDRLFKQKKQLQDIFHKLMLKDDDKRDKKLVEKSTREALKIRESLSLEDTLIILSVNPGDLSLVDTFLDGIPKQAIKSKFLPGLPLALSANLKNNHLSIAKRIVDIVATKFNTLPSLKGVQELENDEFSKYMFSQYHEQYVEEERQSKLRLLAAAHAQQEKERELAAERAAIIEQENLRKELEEKEREDQRKSIAFREAESQHTWFQIEFNSTLEVIERETGSSYRMSELVQQEMLRNLEAYDPFYYRDIPSKRIEQNYSLGLETVDHSTLEVEKRLSDFKKRANDRIQLLESMILSPLMSSKKIELEKMIVNVQNALAKVIDAAKQNLTSIHTHKDTLTKTYEEVTQKIEYQNKQIEDNKRTIVLLEKKIEEDLVAMKKEIQNRMQNAQNLLERLKKGVEEQLLQRNEDSTEYAHKIRTVGEEFDAALTSKKNLLKKIQEDYFKALREIRDTNLIDISFISDLFLKMHQQREEMESFIHTMEKNFDEVYHAVFEDFIKVSDEQRKRKLDMLISSITASATSEDQTEASEQQGNHESESLIFSDKLKSAKAPGDSKSVQETMPKNKPPTNM